MSRPQIDASGVTVQVPVAPQRIVSLVPSVTETLFALGLGARVVGVTEWCVHPAAELRGVTRVRGTKTPDVEAITSLTPDLVLANHEENRALDVRRLRERGVCVWVDYPRTVEDALAQMRWLATLGAAPERAARLIEPIEARIARLRMARPREPRPTAFVAVWRDPWMTIARDTFAAALLDLAGIDNAFELDEGASRYPRVALDEVAARDPALVLLPDEPYRFTDADARELVEGPLSSTAAARSGNVRVVDGTLLFWHGPRIAAALDLLEELRGRV